MLKLVNFNSELELKISIQCNRSSFTNFVGGWRFAPTKLTKTGPLGSAPQRAQSPYFHFRVCTTSAHLLKPMRSCKPIICCTINPVTFISTAKGQFLRRSWIQWIGLVLKRSWLFVCCVHNTTNVVHAYIMYIVIKVRRLRKIPNVHVMILTKIIR